jgi:hypothetical protein
VSENDKRNTVAGSHGMDAERKQLTDQDIRFPQPDGAMQVEALSAIGRRSARPDG